MPKENIFKGTDILVDDDPDFVPPEGFNGFTMPTETLMKLQEAGMVKTKDMTNKGQKAVNDRNKRRKRRKLAKKSKAKNRRRS